MKRLLPAFAMLAMLAPSYAFADEDSDVKEGETPEQHDARMAAQAGHYAAGVRVMVGSGVGKSFNIIGVELGGHYNVSDIISVGARVPLSVKKPDGGAVFGGMMAHAEVRLGATIGVWADVGFMKNGGILISQQDSMFYADGADYALAFALGPWIRAKAGPTYLSIDPAFVYQAGDPKITGAQLPVTALFRASSALKAGAMVGIYTGDDFKLGADKGGRVAAGLVVDLAVSGIAVRAGAGFSSLLTDDASVYDSIGHATYLSVALMYKH